MNRFVKLLKRYQRLLLLVTGVVLVCVAGGVLIGQARRSMEASRLQKELQNMVIEAEQATASPEAAPFNAPTALPEQPTSMPEASLPAAAANETPIPEPQPTDMPQPTVQPKIQSLQERNADCIGWLKSNCIQEIDLPVVQRDNAFYMNHTFDQSYSEYGTAFLDMLCDPLDQSGHLIIYAHNMRSGQMFGKLNRLRDMRLLLSNPFFELDLPYERVTFVPIAVFTCSVRQEDEDFFPIIVPSFASEEHFQQFVQRARELSVHKWLPGAAYGDRLLSLVTCYGDDELTRFVVLLRSLRAGETRQSVSQSILDASAGK